jgi:hypothetical protein
MNGSTEQDTQAEKPRNLFQRLAAVQAELEAVPKTGRNTAFNYAYIEQGMVMAVLRPKMAAHGVILVPRIVGSEQSVANTQRGGQLFTERVRMEFTLVNADDPADTLTVSWLAEGQDSTDKAINKALVAGQKYFLMKLFLISDADDPDAGGEEVNGTTKSAHGAHRAPAPPLRGEGPRHQQGVERYGAQPHVQLAPAGARATGHPASSPQHEADDVATPLLPTAPEDLREKAVQTLRQVCQAIGRQPPQKMADFNALAKELGLQHMEGWSSVTVGWLEALRSRLPSSTQTARAAAVPTLEQTLALQVAAAPDVAALSALCQCLNARHHRGDFDDAARRRLDAAVDRRTQELQQSVAPASPGEDDARPLHPASAS